MSTSVQPVGQTGMRRTGQGKTAGAAQERSVGQTILRVALAVVQWAAIAILVGLTAALIGLSLVWGPTPRPVALLLAALGFGLLAGLVWAARQHLGRALFAATLSLLLLSVLTVGVSQVAAYTPPIVDAQGQAVPGSIATLERVTLNGSEQWISIRGRNVANPVLLWLSGGPGGSQLATARYHLGGLEDHFVVVNWEQPGAGKSYHALPHAQLTAERYIADGHALVRYLQQRFGVEKVYLVGESWGSALGVWLAQRYPELFYAFVGTGQMVDFLETDVFDYQFALQLARERGNTQKVAELERQGPPPYSGARVVWRQSAYLLDGFATMNADPNIAQEDGFDTFQDLLSPEYGLYDKVNWVRGVFDSGDVMFPQLWQADVDFRRDAPRLAVPVYFLIGRHDVNAPPALAEEYYRLLDAPRKEWVWFERSGHNPWVTESQRFVDVVVNRVLAQTPPTATRPTAPPGQRTIALQPCTIGGYAAECGTYLVYEDRLARTGRQISLRVAVVRARDPHPAPDPMVYLAGGPGGAATVAAPGIDPAFRALNARRDWLLVDQRGTGDSHYLLFPPFPPQLLQPGITPAQMTALLESWGPPALQALDGDPRFYTTALAMDDLDEVRAALGYEQVNLYGGSYGATAAQYYLRRHGEHVRTVILDGGTLLDVPLLERIPRSSQRALDLVLARCAADARCQAQFPNVRAEFAAVTERLRQAPVTLDTVMSPITHQALVFDAEVWSVTVHAHLLAANSAAALPRRIHQAYQGDYQALGELYQQLMLRMDENIRLVMSGAIRCSESWARYTPEEVARWGAGSYYLAAQLSQARLQAVSCTFMPPGYTSPDDVAPVRSDVPVLLLNGEADPQDPPEHVASAARDLPNSLQVTVPGHGHGVIQYGCLPELAATFVERGTVAGLDTSCVQDVVIPPFDTRD